MGHTPGPWVASRYSHVDCWRVLYGDNGNWLADVPIDGDEDGARCDARLIAAAPDMLEALLVAETHLRPRSGRSRSAELHRVILAAIAKATGR